MKKIIMTGGGSAGHVMPNIALIEKLRDEGYEIHYIGTKNGIERELVEKYDYVTYHPISSGKLRRYFSLKNLTDPFRVLKGISQSRRIVKKVEPNVVFSKGGFVSVPVVRAAASLKIPCIIHESDMTPGLANKLCIPVSRKICCNFPETFDMLPPEKAVLTGSPIREELSTGNKEVGLAFCGFNHEKPVIMVMGGSQGAAAVNQAIRDALPKLLEKYQVVHLCGKDKMDNLLLTVPGYKQFEYIKEEMKDLLAMADLVISRSGANAISEILALRKPNILIPLPSGRGDQLLNADSYEAQGFSIVINEDDLTTKVLLQKVEELWQNKETYVKTMSESKQRDAIGQIMGLIEENRLK